MPKWYELEVPLERCPLPACRRSKTCRHSTERDPCRRFHETQDDFYYRIADTIDRMKAEMIAARPPGKRVPVAREGTPEFERRLKLLYDALRARDQAESAREIAERRRKAADMEKPARAGDA